MSAAGEGQFGRWNSWFASLPSFPGKLRLMDATAGVVRSFRGNEQEVCLWKEARFGVDLRDRIQRQMWCGCYETHVTQALRMVLRAGDTFVDAGAHIGYHSYFAAGIVGPEGRVFALEADPENFARLKKNLEHFPHAEVYHCAVWSNEEKLIFGRSASMKESGWGTLTRVRETGASEQIEVDGISLDAWTEQAGVKGMHVLKIDVEGAELAVLRGAAKVLQEIRPILFLEMNGPLLKQVGTSATVAEQLLRSKGYVLYRLLNGSMHPWRAVTETELADCIAIPEEHSGVDSLGAQKNPKGLP